jgi:hypothetical protein
MAKANAIASGEPLAIYNLNRAGSPVYVVRSYEPGDEKRPEFIEAFSSQEESGA